MTMAAKPLEPWQLQDAERLRALFQARAELSQLAFGAAHNIGNQSMVSQYLLGRRPLNIDAAKKFAQGLNVAIEEFSPTLAAKIAEASGHVGTTGKIEIDLEASPDTIRVRKVIFKISAGIAGFAVDFLDNGEGTPLYFPKAWADKKGLSPAKLYATRVSGSSMYPTILPSDVVIVNTADTKRAKEAVCAVNHEGEFTVKRLKYEHRRWWLVSDNPDQRTYPPKECTEGTYILGRVVHLHRDF